MKLYNKKPDYVRLDDDVSFQILRTNPKLTTNTKLMYDGENLYMDSYPVNTILSTMNYKHHRVWKTGLFNRDIRNFLLGTNTAAYEVGQVASDTTILNDFDNQFENTYWCGVETINSEIYPQEMGCIAPLYLRKKRPNYFVIVKIDKPANTNAGKGDGKYVFSDDVKKHAKILKTFDLREGTPIGDYISRYVGQRDFEYDKSIYVNFSSYEIYYYGIDKSLGVLTQKVENIEDQMLKNDNTIMKSDNWITSGFERNNLIFPYILNIEFLFDDEIGEYKFARYFGMYCNDIDLYDLGIGNTSVTDGNTYLSGDLDISHFISNNDNNIFYIKDKYNNLHTINDSFVPGLFEIGGNIDKEALLGYEASSVSTFAERLPGTGKAFMILDITEPLQNGETLTAYDEITQETVGTFIATTQYEKGEWFNNRFSCRGNVKDIAAALAGCIRTCTSDNFNWITAFSFGSKTVIQAIHPGANLNKLFNINVPNKIVKLNDYFDGGTDVDNCIFKVYTSDKDIFFDNSGNDRDKTRYLKSSFGREPAEILAVLPYIVDNKIDDTYSILITDSNGPYVNVSKTEQIEIIDKFYPKVGVLSFFPVRDFDCDTIESAYSEYTMIEKELKALQDTMYEDEDETGNNSDSDSEINPEDYGSISLSKKIVESMPYKRFYDGTKEISSEYDYYCENILPELTTANKTVPYIAKWGYMDEAKDSCENPYRLNTSKIFEACNFSANTFMQKGDISEYTHSMPYYLIKPKEGVDNSNEYQYIPYTNEEWTNTYESLLYYFSNPTSDGGDPFDKMFGDVSDTEFTNKRFNKKYSRFLLGNDAIKSSTLFRGVKFEITELDHGKEVKTGKYNDYRFSFIYVPVYNKSENKEEHTVHFIKNDKFKFIVGIVFFDVKKEYPEDVFNKAYVYAGSMGFLKINI